MGKKSKNIINIIKSLKPFVSVCTPTFNRRPFIQSLIACFDHQNYPKDRIEWIIIDDGTDNIEDLVINHPNVKYYFYKDKMPLGKKRNLMHSKCAGDFIVYMDDDDYYPPTRISHAVDMLQKNPKALCAGSSEMYIYFNHIKQMYKFGPYGQKHATAGTFAFRKELLKITQYEDTASLAEEKYFLKNYTIPFVQLDPMQVILIFSHTHNSFDKKKLLVNIHPTYVRKSNKPVSCFIKEPHLIDFFMVKIEECLMEYTEGLPEMKPDVIKQTEQIEKVRDTNIPEHICWNHPTKGNIKLNNNDIVNILTAQSYEIDKLKLEINRLNQFSQSSIIKNIETNNALKQAPEFKGLVEYDIMTLKTAHESNAVLKPVAGSKGLVEYDIMTLKPVPEYNAASNGTTLKPVVESNDTTLKPVVESNDTTLKPVAESNDTTLKLVVESNDTTLKLVVESNDTNLKPVAESNDTTLKPVAESNDTTLKLVVESNDTTLKLVVESNDTNLKPVAESNDTTLKPVAESNDTTLKPVAESNDTNLKPVVESKGLVEYDIMTLKPVPESNAESNDTTLKPDTESNDTTLKPATESNDTTLKPVAEFNDVLKIIKKTETFFDKINKNANNYLKDNPT
jgi:hypothetical protein